MVALWEAVYIEHKRFDLGTLRVSNRSPTPISKSNDSLGQSDDIWGARGRHFRPILGVPGVRAGSQNIYLEPFGPRGPGLEPVWRSGPGDPIKTLLKPH